MTFANRCSGSSLLIHVYSFLISSVVNVQVSELYRRADFSFILKILSFVCNLIHFSFHTGISIENVYCAFLILAVMSLSFLPVSLIVLPKYVHSDPLSTASPWSFNDSCYLVLIGIYFVFWMLIFNPTWPPVSCNLSPLTFISASQCVSKQRFSAYSKSSWCWVSVH